jgi:hypothetical protein
MAAKEPEILEAHCNTCLRRTWHDVLATHDQPAWEAEDESEYEVISPWQSQKFYVQAWVHTYLILRCRGCDAVSFQRVAKPDLVHEGRITEAQEEAIEEATVRESYPPAVARGRPQWIDRLPDSIRSLLGEVYVATAADARSVAAMGLRAIIDCVCTDKVGDAGGFKDKLKALVDGEFTSSRERDILVAALETAHAAAHRAHRPSTDELSRLLDIVEHLLQSMYVLPGVAEELKKTAPKRQKPPESAP